MKRFVLIDRFYPFAAGANQWLELPITSRDTAQAPLRGLP